MPRIGNMLGGTAIVLRGPCFLPDDTIECSFDKVKDGKVEGIFLENSDQPVCGSPVFEEQGWKNLEVTIQRNGQVRYRQSATFYAGKSLRDKVASK